MATLPPLIHLPTAGLAALSLDAPTDPTGAKRDRAGNELDEKDALSVDAIIDRFVLEFGKALRTVKAVAEAAEQTTDALRVEAAVKVITDELEALRAERQQLYDGNDVRDVIRRFAASGGHKAIPANREHLIEQGRRHKNREIELSKEQRDEMTRRYKVYNAFIDSGRYSRLKDIEERLANALPPEAMAMHAEAAIKILSVQPHELKGGKPVTNYNTWWEAFRLFDGVEAHSAVEKSSFAVWVLNNPGECGGQVLGSKWLQDLRFQRVLLQLGEEATQSTHSHEKQTLSMRWKLKCFEWIHSSEGGAFAYPYDNDVGVRTASFLVSVETAARRVRRWMGAQTVASKPASGDPAVGLLGWDFALNLDASRNRWAWDRLEAIAAMGGEAALDKMGARFARRTARRLLMGQKTRKLARIGTSIADEPGTDGADSGSERIEFGIDGTTCPNVDEVLKFIATPPVGSTSSVGEGADPMRMLYPLLLRLSTVTDSIHLEDQRRLLDFRDDPTKEVALVSWGARTRVLFKLHSMVIRVPFPPIERINFKLVDPLGKRGPIPKVLREAFAPGEGAWIEREAEDASHGSCFLSAVMRAMVIAHAASRPNAFKGDVYRAAEASPSEGVAPLCAAVAALARAMHADDKYGRLEVFRAPLPTMKEVREAIEHSITEDTLFGSDTDDDTTTGHQCVLDTRLTMRV